MNRLKTIAKRFEIKEIIAHGGMGEVYRALDKKTSQVVAIKRLNPELVRDNPTFVERFLREGEMLGQLNHPNIVNIIDTITDGSDHYIVMEFIGGGSLDDLLGRNPQLPLERALKIALDLAEALALAHDLNIIHRDLKPANILLSEDGTAHLTDFGAAYLENTIHLTQTNAVIGTYTYMSPEACNGEVLDTRTDIWSFGVTLYEMLAGQRPFDDPQVMHLLVNIMTSPPPDLQQLRPDVSDRLADLVYRMLAKDRSQRIPSARLVGAELEAILEESRSGVAVTTGQMYTSGRFSSSTAVTEMRPRHNLPLIASPFVGREVELAEIDRLLTYSIYRLLTLHGPGGIGKTRLAVQAAFNHLEQFQQGVYFVDLTNIQETRLIVPTIADTIRFNFFGPEEPRVQLLNYLQNKELLLILDNFEQLTNGAELLAEVVQTAPGVHLIVTSRERLNLHEEWVITLKGLPLSEEEESPVGVTAVDFFLQCARRVRPNFAPDDEDLGAIRHICRLLDGLPLGLELAAAWMNMLTPAEIVTEISGDLDFLTAPIRDLPVRQQSLRSIFDYSWKLLKRDEKQIMSRLSVFRGGFDREAVLHIVDASLPTLNALMDKSLLRRSPVTGEYNIQELLRQFAAEKLQDEPAAVQDVHLRHAYYYLNYLRSQAADLRGGQQAGALARIEQRLDNIRAGWQWAVDQKDQKAIALGLEALYHFYQLRGRQRQGVKAFAEAAQLLRQVAPKNSLILAQVIARQGAYCRFVGRIEEARSLLGESLEMARALGDKREIAFSLYNLGAADLANPAARTYWEESLSLAQEIGDQALVAEALNWLAFAAFQEGEFAGAINMLEEGLQLRRILGDEHGLANSLVNLGLIQIHLGNYDSAQALLEESLQINRQLNDFHGMAAACNNLSYIGINRSDYDMAQQWAEQALAYFRQVGDKRGQGFALVNLGEVALYRQQYEVARTLCQESISLHENIGVPASMGHSMLGRIALAQAAYQDAWSAFHRALEAEPGLPLTLEILTGMAAALAHSGAVEEAASLFTFVAEHPASEPLIKERTAGHLAQLTGQLPFRQGQAEQKTLAEWVERMRQHELPAT